MSSTCCSLDHNRYVWILAAFFLGALGAFLENPLLDQSAEIFSTLFVNFLKLVSLPIIFLSIVSTLSGMAGIEEIKSLGKRVIFYTLLTTLISASVALGLYLFIDPVASPVLLVNSAPEESVVINTGGYLSILLETVPSNFFKPFLENQVTGVLFLAALLGFSLLALSEEQRSPLKKVVDTLYACVMWMTKGLLRFMPVAIFAFTLLLFKDVAQGLSLWEMGRYLATVLSANLIQGAVVLPLILLLRGINPFSYFKSVAPALSVAFFTKSSAATLPMALKCVEDAGVSKRVSSFTLPLCTTINMNGCAAFILVTVLFVSTAQGAVFSLPEMALWIPLATIAAVGNAGVPMGCFFLASAFLASMDVPLHLMGVILPFYAIIDMVETALNVWSDCCVASLVQKGEVRDVVADIT